MPVSDHLGDPGTAHPPKNHLRPLPSAAVILPARPYEEPLRQLAKDGASRGLPGVGLCCTFTAEGRAEKLEQKCG
jgi:hypothetical protein